MSKKRPYALGKRVSPPPLPPDELGLPECELREYAPPSWFSERGRYKLLKKLVPRLPDVEGRLFLTFTLDPQRYDDPSSAFDHSRDRLRRLFHRLRKGVEWKGRIHLIDAPYAVKVEFHKNGWAHFHVIFLTRRFLPGALLNKLWDLGRTNVKRISNQDFRYLLKYVTKGGDLPDWVKNRKRIRIWQPSRGFMLPEPESPQRQSKKDQEESKQTRRSFTIEERLTNWSRTAVLRTGDQYRSIKLKESFRDLFDRHV